MRCVTKHLVKQPLIKKQRVLLGCRCAARQNWSVLHGVSPCGSSAAVPGAAGSPPASAAVLPHKWSKEGRGDGTGPSQHSCAEGARWLIHHLTLQPTHTGSPLLLFVPCCRHHRSPSLLHSLLGVLLHPLPPLLTPLPQS